VKIELFTYVELTGLYYDKSAYVLVGVGALIVLVAFGGFMCTARDKVGLLYMVSTGPIQCFVMWAAGYPFFHCVGQNTIVEVIHNICRLLSPSLSRKYLAQY